MSVHRNPRDPVIKQRCDLASHFSFAVLVVGSLFFPSLRSLSAELPPPEAFQVSRDRIAPGPRITSYLRYQLDRAWRQDEQRMARWAAIRTESDWLAWQRETRTRLLELIGGLPSEKTPLNARITGRVQGEGFHIEKVIFESLPRFPCLLSCIFPAPAEADSRRPVGSLPGFP